MNRLGVGGLHVVCVRVTDGIWTSQSSTGVIVA